MGQWRLDRLGSRLKLAKGSRNLAKGSENSAKGSKRLADLGDEALMRRYAKGDAQAFEALYRRHKHGLFAFLRRQCNNHAVAEELAHDAWIAVISYAGSHNNGLSSEQKVGAFKAWIYRIAHNRLIDHWRKHGHRAAAVFEEINEHTVLLSDSSAQGLELDTVVRQLEKLSAEQLSTLLLKIEGFSHSEIADITSAKHETVKSRLRYATQNLRVAMQATLKV